VLFASFSIMVSPCLAFLGIDFAAFSFVVEHSVPAIPWSNGAFLAAAGSSHSVFEPGKIFFAYAGLAHTGAVL